MTDPPEISTAEAELRHAFQDLSVVERWADHIGPLPGRDPLQEGDSLDGPEFCVTTETTDGMHQVVCITGPVGSVAGTVEGTDEAVLRSLVRSLLDLVGHESGPARTTVVLTSAGPRVLECRRGAFPRT